MTKRISLKETNATVKRNWFCDCETKRISLGKTKQERVVCTVPGGSRLELVFWVLAIWEYNGGGFLLVFCHRGGSWGCGEDFARWWISLFLRTKENTGRNTPERERSERDVNSLLFPIIGRLFSSSRIRPDYSNHIFNQVTAVASGLSLPLSRERKANDRTTNYQWRPVSIFDNSLLLYLQFYSCCRVLSWWLSRALRGGDRRHSGG